MNKWPKHIEDCLKASIEHGPDARFTYANKVLELGHVYAINTVVSNLNLEWEFIPKRKPDIEQWGNEYADVGNRIQFLPSLERASKCRSLGCIAVQHRIVDGETGKTKLFETLEVIK